MILYGKPAAAHLSDAAAKKSEELRQQGITPCLGVVRIGERPEDLAYENGLKKRASLCGIDVNISVLDEEHQTAEDVSAVLSRLSNSDKVHGILLFRPLPVQLRDVQESLYGIVPAIKDVDAMTVASAAEVYLGTGRGFAPCTAEACMEILRYYEIDPAGKNVTIISRSPVIGKPVAMLLLKADATVTICHSKTKDLRAAVEQADIVITAQGRVNGLPYEWLHEGQTVLDVSVNRGHDGTCGDLSTKNSALLESLGISYTPVPGGIGAMTSTILMQHVISAALHETK